MKDINCKLTTPCKNCPFRSDVAPYLQPTRAVEIVNGAVYGDAHFICHKTLQAKEASFCAGAIIMAENVGRIPQLLRIYERVGSYVRAKMDFAAPVYKTPVAMINAYRNEYRKKKAH